MRLGLGLNLTRFALSGGGAPPITGLSASTSWNGDGPTNSLSWDAYPDAQSYNLYRDDGLGFALIAGGLVDTTYADTSANIGTYVAYKVTVVVSANVVASAITGILSYGPPDATGFGDANGLFVTDPFAPAVNVGGWVAAGNQPISQVAIYTSSDGMVWSQIWSGTWVGDSLYTAVQSGAFGDIGTSLYYSVRCVNDAGEREAVSGATSWPVYSPQYFGQGASTAWQLNPDSGVYPWRDYNNNSVSPDGISDQPIYAACDWDHGASIALGRGGYEPVVEQYTDNGFAVAKCEFSAGNGHNFQLVNTLDPATDDYTIYAVFYYDPFLNHPLLLNHDYSESYDVSSFCQYSSGAGTVILDSDAYEDDLFIAGIPDWTYASWRVLVLQRRAGILSAKISDGLGSGSGVDSITSVTQQYAITAIGPDDVGSIIADTLRIKSIGFANVANADEMDFLFQYLRATFL